MKPYLLFISFFICSILGFPQQPPITVSEQTIKVNGDNEFYFGFSKGDQIIFELEVIKGKNVKEVEILEYPNTSKFFEYKATKISGKKLKVNKTAIYKFRLKGGGIGTKICRAKILRVPASKETVDFNTSVKWKTRKDSTYETRYRKVLTKVDTQAIQVIDRVERVHSTTNLSNSNRSQFNVQLPSNERSQLRTSEIIGWAYWFGVGDEGLAQYEEEKKKYLKEQSASIGAMIDPIAGLALGAYAMLAKPPTGDNVHYWITTYINEQAYSIASGNSVTASGRVTDITQGGFTVTFDNDNTLNGINVSVKITAIKVTKTYKNESYRQLLVTETEYPSLE